MNLNIVDFGILIVIVFFAYRGYSSGLINQVTSLVAMVFGIYFASEQYKIFADAISDKFELASGISQLLAFSLLVIIVSLLINYLGHLLSGLLDLVFLSIVDNVAGSFFGLIKGVAIIYVLVLVLINLPINIVEQYLSDSVVVTLLLDHVNPLFTEKINGLIN
ncbi:MAG: CvpA family protein [Bacillota bacterium]